MARTRSSSARSARVSMTPESSTVTPAGADSITPEPGPTRPGSVPSTPGPPGPSAWARRSSSPIFSASTWITPLRSNIQATAPEEPMWPPNFSKVCRSSGAVRLRLSVRTRIIRATPPAPYPSYVISSYASPGSSPVPFWMARLMFSCGMLASLAASMAAFRRMLALGSPPPLRAATVISRRILENSLPRWTSVLAFFRLIWAQRECPDIALTSNGGLEPLHPLQAQLASRQGRVPTPALGRGLRRERPGWARRPLSAQVHEGPKSPARVADLAGPGLFRPDLDADLQRGGPDVGP